ncbi:insulinase family protein [Thalassotalea mangrovi]|uniref:Protease 3 n=1 Tax=Thalassotalea mangrovi TaxID=2572245 RepID=A0A4U1B2R1_9GAMM|nr:insulinase family protein [Thalassotalea mangrovi]TKB44078.1 peptidase M16 [Thalassotalea mangrovi]
MKSSPNDPRQYHSFVLDNGLRVVVVENDQTTRAAASLVVNTGHFDDPDDAQGMAHFLEHMLFLGTKSFPDSGEYQQFITQHNGSNNAWTGTEHTCFYFDIDQQYLEPALHRFSRFFCEPELSRQYIESERNNVDAEFKLKLKEDLRRIYDVHKETVNPAHPFRKFSVGNLETLRDKPGFTLQQAVADFYHQHYHAQLMTLAVESPHPVAVSESWTKKYFTDIASNSKLKPVIAEPLYLPEHLALTLSITPHQLQHKLVISFALPGLDPFYENKPVSYLSYLLGHEGPGSILSYLKKRNWALSLTSGGGVNGSNFKDFNISIRLTEKGIKYQHEIIDVLFSYLQLMRSDGIRQLYFDEKRALSEFAFRYKELNKPLDNVNQLAINMQHYPPADYIYGDYKMQAFNPGLLNRFLDFFTPDNMRVQEIRPGLECDQVSRWYQTPYSTKALPKALLNRWENIASFDELTLPPANPYIVRDPQIYPGESMSQPDCIYETSGLKFWFKQDQSFRSPKGQIYISLESPMATKSARNIAMMRLFVELFSESVQEQNYQAELAGIHYQVYAHQGGITIHISGISEKQPLLLDNLLMAICDHSLATERFQLFKKQLIQGWRNHHLNKPVSQLFAYLNALLKPHSPHSTDLANNLQHAGLDEFKAFCASLFSTINVEAFAYGNWPADQALQLAKAIESHLSHALNDNAQVKPLVTNYSETTPVGFPVAMADSDHACVLYFALADKAFSTKALAIMASQVLAPDYFHQLRTEKQLGYLLGINYLTMNQYPGLACYVQSPHMPSVQLGDEIMEFLQKFSEKKAIAGWEKLKQGVLNQLDEKDSGPRVKGQRYWHSISNHDYHFNNRTLLRNEIARLSDQQVLTFIKTQLTSAARCKPLVLTSHSSVDDVNSDPPEQIVYREIEHFHQQYPYKY